MYRRFMPTENTILVLEEKGNDQGPCGIKEVTVSEEKAIDK